MGLVISWRASIGGRACAAVAGVVLVCAGLTGCGGGSSVVMESGAERSGGGAALEPVIATAVYAPIDDNTADIYLTDLTRRELDGSVRTERLSGSIVHIYLFIFPTPGRTPSDRGAVSAGVRYIVLARGETGVYGGGGCLRPDSKPGGAASSGSMREGSMRLVHATEGFRDLLGPSTLDLSFNATRDEGMARLISSRLIAAIDEADVVAEDDPMIDVGP